MLLGDDRTSMQYVLNSIMTPGPQVESTEAQTQDPDEDFSKAREEFLAF
jgi:hypothetical protein